MKLKIERAHLFSNSIQEIQTLIGLPYFMLFLFGKKNTFETSMKNLKEAVVMKNFLHYFCESVLDKKVYSYLGNNSKSYSIYISKVNIEKKLNLLVKYRKSLNLELGEILGYPACCVKRYCEEAKDTSSFHSVVRYRTQCKSLDIKDNFYVNFAYEDNVGFLLFGFVPCSPKCPNAIKILNEYNKIQGAIKNAK